VVPGRHARSASIGGDAPAGEAAAQETTFTRPGPMGGAQRPGPSVARAWWRSPEPHGAHATGERDERREFAGAGVTADYDGCVPS